MTYILRNAVNGKEYPASSKEQAEYMLALMSAMPFVLKVTYGTETPFEIVEVA